MQLTARTGFHVPRRGVQMATLLMLVLIPALGLFRIDLARGSLLIAGQVVHLRDFPVVAGLAIVLATAPLLMVTTVGTLWCGWACPQNTVSEWANGLTRRLLGVRADVNVEGAGLAVAPSKNRLANWAALALRLVAAATLLGVIPLFYFFPPGEVWALVSFGEATQLSVFIHRIYLVSAAAAFVDVALIRYFLCNYVCLYRIGLLLFRNPHALRVAHDTLRAGECAKCNYCRVSCVTGIDPTAIKRFDRCINCAECIDACNRLQAKRSNGIGLLRFVAGDAGAAERSGIADRVLAAIGWHGLVFAGGCALLVYGMSAARG